MRKETVIDYTKEKLDVFIKYLTVKSNQLAELQKKPVLKWEYDLDQSMYTLKSDPHVSIQWDRGLCSSELGWRWQISPKGTDVMTCSKDYRTTREAMLSYERYLIKGLD